MYIVVSFATSWSARHGGINTFNREIILALAINSDPSELMVCCVVPSASAEEKEECLSSRVTLIESGEKAPIDSVVTLIADKIPKGAKLIWMGHDVITGEFAIDAAKILPGKVGIFHHMNYEAYMPLKRPTSQDRLSLQRSILTRADVVFPVGPRLKVSAEDKTRGKKIGIVPVIPGLTEIEVLEKQPKIFSALVYGRFDRENDKLKQLELAVRAFGRAIKSADAIIGGDPSLTVIGMGVDSDAEEIQRLQAILEEEAERAAILNCWEFTENRGQLLSTLSQQSVCMVLSLHEGFGLTAWEAIAAAVPVIVSKNTGAYDAIESLLGGVGTGCIYPVTIRGSGAQTHSHQESDIDTVAGAIIQVALKEQAAKTDSICLKRLLAFSGCTWESAARTIMEKIGVDALNEQAFTAIADWTPEVLLDALERGRDVVSGASRRKEYFERIIDGLKPPASISDRVIFFGGVSQALCAEEYLVLFTRWLEHNPTAKVFFCYEVAEAAESRAILLDESSLETESGLPAAAKERMLEKQRRVESVPKQIEAIGSDDGIGDRIVLVPITKPVSTYVVITDIEVYLTPLFERRASESVSFALSGRASSVEIIKSILHHIEIVEPPSKSAELLAAEIRVAFDLTK